MTFNKTTKTNPKPLNHGSRMTIQPPRCPHESLGTSAYARYLHTYEVYLQAVAGPPRTSIIITRQAQLKGSVKSANAAAPASPRKKEKKVVPPGEKRAAAKARRAKRKLNRKLGEIQDTLSRVTSAVTDAPVILMDISDSVASLAKQAHSVEILDSEFRRNTYQSMDAVSNSLDNFKKLYAHDTQQLAAPVQLAVTGGASGESSRSSQIETRRRQDAHKDAAAAFPNTRFCSEGVKHTMVWNTDVKPARYKCSRCRRDAVPEPKPSWPT
jgi:hypothetical protein